MWPSSARLHICLSFFDLPAALITYESICQVAAIFDKRVVTLDTEILTGFIKLSRQGEERKPASILAEFQLNCKLCFSLTPDTAHKEQPKKIICMQ